MLPLTNHRDTALHHVEMTPYQMHSGVSEQCELFGVGYRDRIPSDKAATASSTIHSHTAMEPDIFQVPYDSVLPEAVP